MNSIFFLVFLVLYSQDCWGQNADELDQLVIDHIITITNLTDLSVQSIKNETQKLNSTIQVAEEMKKTLNDLIENGKRQIPSKFDEVIKGVNSSKQKTNEDLKEEKNNFVNGVKADLSVYKPIFVSEVMAAVGDQKREIQEATRQLKEEQRKYEMDLVNKKDEFLKELGEMEKKFEDQFESFYNGFLNFGPSRRSIRNYMNLYGQFDNPYQNSGRHYRNQGIPGENFHNHDQQNLNREFLDYDLNNGGQRFNRNRDDQWNMDPRNQQNSFNQFGQVDIRNPNSQQYENQNHLQSISPNENSENREQNIDPNQNSGPRQQNIDSNENFGKSQQSIDQNQKVGNLQQDIDSNQNSGSL